MRDVVTLDSNRMGGKSIPNDRFGSLAAYNNLHLTVRF